ncbi:hypothetical protein BCR35DRAFT_298551 [Leucosporidium creatinivorum]|uniref:Uncharacterized protein n=1 Tax=Leucosporidium creatinivorum TaxID=106004 RepID=A0A1Y2G4R9_9BASI|nr:hypothetical protein BCR35DRAFT_298551 [Leucosporidium creatinivorum]
MQFLKSFFVTPTEVYYTCSPTTNPLPPHAGPYHPQLGFTPRTQLIRQRASRALAATKVSSRLASPSNWLELERDALELEARVSRHREFEEQVQTYVTTLSRAIKTLEYQDGATEVETLATLLLETPTDERGWSRLHEARLTAKLWEQVGEYTGALFHALPSSSSLILSFASTERWAPVLAYVKAWEGQASSQNPTHPHSPATASQPTVSHSSAFSSPSSRFEADTSPSVGTELSHDLRRRRLRT